MRIAIEALGIDVPGGGRSATLNLLDALFARDARNQYTLVLTRPEPRFAHRENVRQLVSGRLPPVAARLWAQAVLPVYLRAWEASLVHHVKNLTVASPGCPSIVTVHDVTTLRHAEMFPTAEVWYWRHLEPRALRAAARVVTISRTAAAEIAETYGLPLEAIEVVYDSYAPHLGPTAGDPAAVRRRHGIEGPFALHVGSISRKKNLPTLARAFARLRARGVLARLVLVGRAYSKARDDELGEVIAREGLAGDVVFTGPISEEELPGFYRAAAVTVFPSLHEGFGMVPIEAMACGCPVVTSRGGALPEVVGDAALTTSDPLDAAELADLVERAVSDEATRERLVASGFERAKLFTAERAAEATLRLYEQIAG